MFAPLRRSPERWLFVGFVALVLAPVIAQGLDRPLASLLGAQPGGALLTPADPLSQVMMAVPLIVFYEVGILLASTMQKRREAAQAAALDDEPVAD